MKTILLPVILLMVSSAVTFGQDASMKKNSVSYKGNTLAVGNIISLKKGSDVNGGFLYVVKSENGEKAGKIFEKTDVLIKEIVKKDKNIIMKGLCIAGSDKSKKLGDQQQLMIIVNKAIDTEEL